MRISICCLSFILICFLSFAEAKNIHNVFFEGTDYELSVYRVYGKEPGKTILLIGGIQGDEPGGFLSADSYADMSLVKGNLIVVPRANFHSILLNQRQVNEDMNRKFADDNWANYETKVVAILKDLIADSDCLLNLHDGSGFYSDKWESDQRNPKRYGQSIIADYEIFEIKGKKTLMLGDIGREVVEKINKKIKKKDYLFHFNNHDTGSLTTIHKVQRKSATYYALTKCGIPAFGVETSKSLPLELKIRHHVFAINAFMEKFGVIPEFPAVNLDKPDLKYLVLAVNNSLPVVVKAGQTLSINPSDSIEIMHIEANYERGLSADIVGLGSVNDSGKSIVINKPTRIIVKKDHYPCGDVYVSLNGGAAGNKGNYTVVEKKGGSFLIYKVKVNGENFILDNYGVVNLTSGDVFEVEDVIATEWDSSEFVVNFKGYVGNSSVNTGEDRGFSINTAKDLWPSYSLNKKGKRYQIVTSSKKAVLGKLYVVVNPPVLDYLIIKNGDRGLRCLENGGRISFDSSKKDMTIELVDIISNVDNNTGIDVALSGAGDENSILKIGKPLEIVVGGEKTPFTRLDVSRYGEMMGSITINYLPESDIRRTGQDEQI